MTATPCRCAYCGGPKPVCPSVGLPVCTNRSCISRAGHDRRKVRAIVRLMEASARRRGG